MSADERPTDPRCHYCGHSIARGTEDVFGYVTPVWTHVNPQVAANPRLCFQVARPLYGYEILGALS